MTELKPGVAAPNFTTKSLDGSEISIAAMRGKKIWLAFYRYAGCPLCNLYLSEISHKTEQLRKDGLQMIAVFESTPDMFPDNVRNLPYTRYLISDPKKDLYFLYEVETRLGAALHPGAILKWIEATAGKGFSQPMPDGALGTVPAHFLINEEGILTRVKYGNHIGDHISFDDVEDFICPKKSFARD